MKRIEAFGRIVALILAVSYAQLNARAASVGTVQNLSLLVDIPAGGTSPPVGFVITGAATPFLVRAVGPSLARFGVAHPAAAPQLQFFDSRGSPLIAITVVTLTTPIGVSSPPPPDFAGAMAALGAFPISSSDAFTFVNIPPGSYTVRATDRTGGTVLIEMYQGAPPASTGVAPGTLGSVIAF